ncbi:DUF2218 domain-containing protein [Amorphus sp. 3PC139-8]|uniref:DUF2218 domain-containing protein n=1 Tax=Amorphus sp. 3PC139-8 TaxID=2735676 RepID=UPI00345D5220
MPQFTARAAIAFPNIDAYLDQIAASLAAHNMDVQADGDGYDVRSAFGTAHLETAPSALHLLVQAEDPAAFNRMKHDLTSLIDFVARSEALTIVWTGDATGAAPPPDLRILTVRTVHDLTPRMRRFTLQGDDLGRYAVSDQIHCRLLFQEKGTHSPEWPHLGDNGRILWPAAGKLATRIYTIRRIDPASGTLDIDFFMHGGKGPGVKWANTASPGDIVGILGPAAYGPKPADWVLLAGDETGLPGIARILENLPASAQGVALIEVADTREEQPIEGPSGVEIRWLHRNGAASGTTSLLADTVCALDLPADKTGLFFWGGAEFATFKTMRTYLTQEIGLPRSRIVAFSHWRRGMSEEEIAEAGASAISA